MSIWDLFSAPLQCEEPKEESGNEVPDEVPESDSPEAEAEAKEDTEEGEQEEEEEEEEEAEDPAPAIQEECAHSKACAAALHHFEECQERIQEGKPKFGAHEDCVEEFCKQCRFIQVKALWTDSNRPRPIGSFPSQSTCDTVLTPAQQPRSSQHSDNPSPTSRGRLHPFPTTSYIVFPIQHYSLLKDSRPDPMQAKRCATFSSHPFQRSRHCCHLHMNSHAMASYSDDRLNPSRLPSMPRQS